MSKKNQNFSKVNVVLVLTLVFILIVSLSSCGAGSSSINLITREEGSGTRDAFVSLVDLKQENGGDNISQTAEVTNNTSVMMSSVSSNESAIGYISLGSYSDIVKALSINNVAATKENVKNETYPLKRPFNIVYKKDKLSTNAKVFIDFILSKEGQTIISKNGYVENSNAKKFSSNVDVKGSIKVGGSSSVSPVMEKIAEGFKKIYKNINIEIQTTDSSSGVSDCDKGINEIGMVSRDLDSSEPVKTLTVTKICLDGIAVIVNKKNELTSLTIEQIRDIFNGTIKSFSDLSK